MAKKIGFVLGATGALGSALVARHSNKYEVVCVDIKDDSKIKNKFLNLDMSKSESQDKLINNILNCGEQFSFIVDATGSYTGGTGSKTASSEYLSNTIGWQSLFFDKLAEELIEAEHYKHSDPLFLHILSGASFNGSRDINYSVAKSAQMGLVLGLARKYSNKIIQIGLASGCLDGGMADKMANDRKKLAIARTVNNVAVPTEELSIFAEQLIESKLNSLNGIIIPFGENPAWIDYVTS